MFSISRILPAAFVISVFTVANAYAAGLHAVRTIPGYVCMSVNLTEQELADPNITVPTKSEPSASAPNTGTAPETVFVADPPDLSNGYYRILRLDGKTAWIAKDAVKTWAPPNPASHAHCHPSIMSDGKPGFSIH